MIIGRFVMKRANLFEIIDKTTRVVSDRELSAIKKVVRAHAFFHVI